MTTHTDLIARLLDNDRFENPDVCWIDRDDAADALEAQQKEIEELRRDAETAWGQAHRLALELECLLNDCNDQVVQARWWDSSLDAISEYHELKPGAADEAEAWRQMRKFDAAIDAAMKESE